MYMQYTFSCYNFIITVVIIVVCSHGVFFVVLVCYCLFALSWISLSCNCSMLVLMFSDSEQSDVEARISALREQLRNRRKEAKDLEKQRREHRRQLLRQQEAVLKKKLEVSLIG